MIKKAFTPKRTICKVTFTVPAEWADKKITLVGDFNDWDKSEDKLAKKKGNWEITKRLKPENEYRFKYLVDGTEWKNDDSADAYVGNEYGSEDSVVKVGK